MRATKRTWRKTAAWFAVLAAVMGALQWNWFAMPLERDEGEYAYAAWLMRTGKGVPYQDSFLQKPPMIVYTYALVEALAPKSDKVGFRVAGFLAALAAAGLVWGLGQREFGGRAGLWGAWMWAVFLQQMTLFNSVAANVEKFMVVPMLGAMALAGRGERRDWRWGLAGAMAGMAVLYKPICVPVLGVWFLWTVFSKAKEGKEDNLEDGGQPGCGRERTGGEPPDPPGAPKSRPPQGVTIGMVWRRLVWLVLGGILALMAGVAWFAWKGALGALWECAVLFTGEYAKLMGHPWQMGVAFLAMGAHWKAWVVLGLALVGFIAGGRRSWSWGAVFSVAWGVAMTNGNGHYYVMALPLAALGAGAGIECLAKRMENKGRWGGWAGAASVVTVSVIMLSGLESEALRCSPEQLAAGLYQGNPFVEAEGAGTVVAALCPENGTVHIVGSEPEILWYARRKGATRFDIAYPLSLPTRHAAEYQAEALEALQRETPDVVVFVRTGLGFLGMPETIAGYLRAMTGLVVGGGYRLEWSFVAGRGGWLQGGTWPEHEAAGGSMGIWRWVSTDAQGGTPG